MSTAKKMIRLGAAAAAALLFFSACGAVSLPDAGRTCPDGTVDTGSGCALKRPLGQSCSAATACQSGYCQDGVCCESACGGACLRCDQGGRCVGEPQLTAEAVCGAYVCGEGRCLSTCTRDAHCAADAHCENRQCVSARGQGAFCTADNQCKSKHCVDGYCCDSACAEPCDSCALVGSEGRCSTLSAGQAGSPSCGSFLCDGLASSCPAGCASDALCVGGRYCDLLGACAPRRATGTPCNDARQCLSGFCADGFCCDDACTGPCDVCDAAGDEGSCRLEAAGAAGDPSCSPLVCNGKTAACPAVCASDFECIAGRFCGAGGCQLQKSNGITCTQGRECQSGFCTDGVCCDQACQGQCDACNQLGTIGQCQLMPLASFGNPPCSPYSCNGQTPNCGLACTTVGPGAPCSSTEWCDGVACARKGVPGNLCTQDYQCLSGACVDGVCCDNACSGACDRCNLRGFEGSCTPLAAGTTVAACGSYTCDGISGACPAACSQDSHCVSSRWCDGTTCAPKRVQGQGCLRDEVCQSGHCANSYCCDLACNNACDACNVLGLEGSCSAAPAGATPAPACGSYVCNGLSVGCPVTCATDADCTASAFCNNNVCEPARVLGQSCSRDRACGSGHCADAVCCDQPCNGACDTCFPASGTCTALARGALGTPSCSPFVCDGNQLSCPMTCDSGQDCAAGFFCTGADGTCAAKLPDGAACGTNNAVCLSGHCADGVCCNVACNGGCEACDINPGTCTAYQAGAGGVPSCGNYACDGVSGQCPTTCPGTPTVQASCAGTHYCVANLCTPKKAPGVSCFDGLECGSGFCVDGVCCNSACGGACDACNVVPGTCSAAPQGASGSPTCFPYVCDGSDAGCPSTCDGAEDCATGTCSGGACLRRGLGEGCAASFECTSVCCDRTTSVCTAGPANCL